MFCPLNEREKENYDLMATTISLIQKFYNKGTSKQPFNINGSCFLLQQWQIQQSALEIIKILKGWIPYAFQAQLLTLKEIHNRLALGRLTMKTLVKIFRCFLNLKDQYCADNVTFLGSKSWTLKKQHKKRIDTLECSCCRRLVTTYWIARKVNKCTIERISLGPRSLT